MDTSTPFKWRHFQAEIILLCVRSYLRYPLSYRDLEEIMRERGLHVPRDAQRDADLTTLYLLALKTLKHLYYFLSGCQASQDTRAAREKGGLQRPLPPE